MLFQSLQDDSGEGFPVHDAGHAVGTNGKDSLATELEVLRDLGHRTHYIIISRRSLRGNQHKRYPYC